MRRVLILVMLIGNGLTPVSADDDHERARRWREEGRVVPLAQIVDDARSRYAGRLLEADLKRKGDRYYYEIEIVDSSGVVWELKYDATNGELLNEEKEH